MWKNNLPFASKAFNFLNSIEDTRIAVFESIRHDVDKKFKIKIRRNSIFHGKKCIVESKLLLMLETHARPKSMFGKLILGQSIVIADKLPTFIN